MRLRGATGSRLRPRPTWISDSRQGKVIAVASGGARARSGPPADPNALRRSSSSDGEWLTLPASGRPGNAPAWPLTTASAREREIWRRLWKLPQAVAWQQLLLHDQVALYCRRLAIAEHPDATAAEATLARQLQDALGLSAPGLRSMRWRIEQVEKTKKPEVPLSSARDRLRVVQSDEHAS